MAEPDSNIEEYADKLEAEIRGLGLMVKGLYEVVGSGIEQAEVVAMNEAYIRIYSSYREFTTNTFAALKEVNHG
jgi:hypothetical protein